MKGLVDRFHLLVPLLNQILPAPFAVKIEGEIIITKLGNEDLAKFDLFGFRFNPQEPEDHLDTFLSGLQDQVSVHTGRWWPSGRSAFPNLTVRVLDGAIQLLLDGLVLAESDS